MSVINVRRNQFYGVIVRNSVPYQRVNSLTWTNEKKNETENKLNFWDKKEKQTLQIDEKKTRLHCFHIAFISEIICVSPILKYCDFVSATWNKTVADREKYRSNKENTTKKELFLILYVVIVVERCSKFEVFVSVKITRIKEITHNTRAIQTFWSLSERIYAVNIWTENQIVVVNYSQFYWGFHASHAIDIWTQSKWQHHQHHQRRHLNRFRVVIRSDRSANQPTIYQTHHWHWAAHRHQLAIRPFVTILAAA